MIYRLKVSLPNKQLNHKPTPAPKRKKETPSTSLLQVQSSLPNSKTPLSRHHILRYQTNIQTHLTFFFSPLSLSASPFSHFSVLSG